MHGMVRNGKLIAKLEHRVHEPRGVVEWGYSLRQGWEVRRITARKIKNLLVFTHVF